MKILKAAAVLLGVALVAIPAGAAIRAMTLTEAMELNSDVIHGRIVSKTTVKTDRPLEGMVYTHMTVEGESLTTGEKVTRELVFLGSHDPKDNYGTSEMPTQQDTRIGADALILYAHDESGTTPVDRVSDFSAVYRVESAFDAEPVVIGKGEGFAFPENVKLAEARTRVLKARADIIAAQLKAGK